MLCFGISFPKKRCLVWVNFKSYPLQMKNISEMPVLEFHSPVSRGGRKLFCRADGTVSQTLISINQCSFIEVKGVIFHVRSWPGILSAAVLDWHQALTPGWRRHLMHAGIPTSVATASLFLLLFWMARVGSYCTKPSSYSQSCINTAYHTATWHEQIRPPYWSPLSLGTSALLLK